MYDTNRGRNTTYHFLTSAVIYTKMLQKHTYFFLYFYIHPPKISILQVLSLLLR